MTTATPDPLAPIRSALLSRAEERAARLRADARAGRDRRLASARERADRLRAEAELRGRAEAEAAAAAAVIAAEREAQRLLLAARSHAYQELRAAVTARVAALLTEAAVGTALRARIGELLGPGATVVSVPGGLSAVAGDRRVEVRAADLADAALEELGPAVEELWRP